MVLSEELQAVFDFVAEEQPVPPVVGPLRPFVGELMALGLVTCDEEGRWITTPRGEMLSRHDQGGSLH